MTPLYVEGSHTTNSQQLVLPSRSTRSGMRFGPFLQREPDILRPQDTPGIRSTKSRDTLDPGQFRHDTAPPVIRLKIGAEVSFFGAEMSCGRSVR